MKGHRKRLFTWIYIILIWTLGCLPPRLGGYSCLGNPLPYPAVDLTAIDTDTPVYLEVGPPTDTPNPFESKPYFTLEGNAFCRAGFSKEYHEVEVLLEGSRYPVEGQKEDGSWLLLDTGEHLCWVSASTGSTQGSLEEIDFTLAPTMTPLVIEAPVQERNCAKYKDEISCMDHSGDGCSWVIPGGNDPYCAGP